MQSLWHVNDEVEELDAVAAMRCGTSDSTKYVEYLVFDEEDLRRLGADLRQVHADVGPLHVAARHVDWHDPGPLAEYFVESVARTAKAGRITKAKYKQRIREWHDAGLIRPSDSDVVAAILSR